MVLELLVNPAHARGQPFKALLLGFIYASVALVIGMWIFESDVSLVAVFLTVLAAFPLFYDLLSRVAREEYSRGTGTLLWKEHSKTVNVLFFLFVGVMLAFMAWYLFLPVESLPATFRSQTGVIQGMDGFSIADSPLPFFGTDGKMRFFAEILLNNLGVLLFCVLFSFLYGAGAVFIIVWNASVIGVALGNFLRSGLSQTAAFLGLAGPGDYFHVISLGVARYSVHGITEIVAYLIAGLAGSMISLGLFYGRKDMHNFRELLADVLELTGVAVLLLVVSAWLEAFVSTALF